MSRTKPLSEDLSPPKPNTPGFNPLLLPELVHELIPHLAPRTLLTCQRVCRTWHDVIERSPAARRQLFLDPDYTALAPLLAAEAGDVLSEHERAFLPPNTRLTGRQEFRALFNPWVLRGVPFQSGWEMFPRGWCYEARAPRRTEWWVTDRVSSGAVGFVMRQREFLGAIDEREKSWRDMLIVQPPVKRLLGYVGIESGIEEPFVLKREGGVRVRDVLAAAGRTGVVKGLRGLRRRKLDEIVVRMWWQFDEHFNGVRRIKFVQLERDEQGAVQVAGRR